MNANNKNNKIIQEKMHFIQLKLNRLLINSHMKLWGGGGGGWNSL